MKEKAKFKTWLSWAWKILSKLSESWLDREPTSTQGYDADTVSSGSIEFNGKTYGADAYHQIQVEDTQDEIDAFAQTNILHWLDKIAIVIFDPMGNSKKSITAMHNQHLYYQFKESDSPGVWKVQYVATNHLTWDLWLTLWHYNSSGHESEKDGNSTGCGIHAFDSSGSKKRQYDQNIVYRTENKTYIVPSDAHKTRTAGYRNKPLDIKELSLQFFDSINRTYVHSLKDYGIGDGIAFADTIKNIRYDKEENATFFTIEGHENEDIRWAFSGDLTNRYKAGDVLELKFTVVAEYADDTFVFETLDYLRDGANLISDKKYPSIEKYLS